MKILYVTTISNTVNAFLVPHIKMLVDQGHQVDLAFNIKNPVNHEIIDMGCKVHTLEFERYPFNKGNCRAYKNIKAIIKNEKYDLVHTHTPIASTIVRLACKNMKNTKVFYTAHGFHFFKGAPLRNWLLYYPIEKWLSKYTDCLITINKEDYERARKSFSAQKVEYMPGVGFDVKKFKNIKIDKETKRDEIGVSKDGFVVLSVGELNKNKNHKIIIEAISKLNNSNIHYVICGKGSLDNYLRELAENLNIKEQVHLLGRRSDIAEICKASDIFAFPSRREGLGLAALEAMACGLPIVTSNVHGIVDYSIDGKTGFTCDPKNVDEFAYALDKLYSDNLMREKMGTENINLVNTYDIHRTLDILNDNYSAFSKKMDIQ